jgi:hypothetical protein
MILTPSKKLKGANEVGGFVLIILLIIIHCFIIVNRRFISTNEENGCGWVINAPFTTNCESVRYAKRMLMW